MNGRGVWEQISKENTVGIPAIIKLANQKPEVK